MKKLLFTAAIAVLGFASANAQDDTTNTTGGFAQGDIFLSGSVGFGNETTGDVKSNVFTIAPKAGYFVSDNIAVGVKLGYTSWKGDNDGTDTVDANEFAGGVFGRYYMTPANQFSLFAELGVDYTSSDDKLADLKSDGVSAGFAPGISYFVSDKFAIEASFGILGYSTEKADFDGAESTDNFNFGLNFSNINFGIVYNL
ncbi:outer membrane beta-barrel protein [Lacinutrix sp. WUR7]|uniref:outer membrane beta-barrel protein n=1 Tax=Lacinutrix sp. WUR7 TaxID=2653681 RepID=UPI00193D65AC|nr:outer membrane beta-barrel protein [Lacinutrix sp. WUR7]QRM90501.1 outer membrane beta-barrel protein [Lacinutrix sp. WUR7]